MYANRVSAPIAPVQASGILPLMENLTPAERLVALHLAEGLTDKEIAAVLGKAAPTVKNQISSILYACAVSNRGRFIALYHQQSLARHVAASRATF